MVQVHADRLHKIDDTAVKTGDPKEGFFPKGMRIHGKIFDSQTSRNDQSGNDERWFKVQLGGRRLPRWTKESYLPEAVVKLYDLRMKERKLNQDFEGEPNVA